MEKLKEAFEKAGATQEEINRLADDKETLKEILGVLRGTHLIRKPTPDDVTKRVATLPIIRGFTGI